MKPLSMQYLDGLSKPRILMKPESDYPFVSFVTTCYNAEAVIAEAVRGMLAVEWPNKEIILLNDGSDDATGDICRKLAAENDCIRFLDRPRLGRARALNEAVEAAQGRYIALNDADDVSLPNRLTVTIPVLGKNSHIGLLTTSARMVPWSEWGAYSQPIGDGQRDLELEFISPGSLYGKNKLVASTMVFRKRVFHAVGGFNETLSSSIDSDFYFRVLTDSKIARLDVVTCRHRTGYAYTTFFRDLPAKQKLRNKLTVRAFARKHFRIPLTRRVTVFGSLYWAFFLTQLRQDAPRLFAFSSALKRRLFTQINGR